MAVSLATDQLNRSYRDDDRGEEPALIFDTANGLVNQKGSVFRVSQRLSQHKLIGHSCYQDNGRPRTMSRMIVASHSLE